MPKFTERGHAGTVEEYPRDASIREGQQDLSNRALDMRVDTTRVNRPRTKPRSSEMRSQNMRGRR